MKTKAFLAGFALLATTAANAATFTQSDFAGTGTFGTASAVCDNLACTMVDVSITMDPNLILNTGSHFPLTLSLAGSGTIDAASIVFGGGQTGTVLAKTSPASYSNSPFGLFNTGINADCGNGSSSGGCGSTLAFTIDNFSGFLAATNLFNGVSILAAVDIFLNGCTGNSCTGAVGLTGDLTPTPQISAVPIPAVGTGLPGILAGALFLFRWMRRRREGLHLPEARRFAVA